MLAFQKPMPPTKGETECNCVAPVQLPNCFQEKSYTEGRGSFMYVLRSVGILDKLKLGVFQLILLYYISPYNQLFYLLKYLYPALTHFKDKRWQALKFRRNKTQTSTEDNNPLLTKARIITIHVLSRPNAFWTHIFTLLQNAVTGGAIWISQGTEFHYLSSVKEKVLSHVANISVSGRTLLSQNTRQSGQDHMGRESPFSILVPSCLELWKWQLTFWTRLRNWSKTGEGSTMIESTCSRKPDLAETSAGTKCIN